MEPEDNGSIIKSEKIRGYIYRVFGAATPILTAWGLIAESMVPLYIALAGAVLGFPLAAANTKTSKKEDS